MDADKRHYGGFLTQIDQFDADFFDISQYEAERLDPQGRLLMETTWEALEDSGIIAADIAGSQTGVYMNSFQSGYWDMLRANGVLDVYSLMESGPWQSPAGRISYQLDLRGPSMGIEATCAASMLAVHLACRALWHGEIPMALVGGANVILDPVLDGILDNADLLSPSGRIRFADSNADGYIRGEGAAVIVLKPLEQAIADDDQVYATIIGTGVTHNGRTGGRQFTPGQDSQEQMLRAAYTDAGISPGEVDYIEAHGTGTAVGDPVELAALTSVMGQGRKADEPCFVGSVKSNIGHSEGTAGLAGLLKVALSIRESTIPATLHVARPRSVLHKPSGPLTLPLTTVKWPERGRRRVAGVTSSGASGTNVHVVMAESPITPRPPRVSREVPRLLCLSARNQDALRNLAMDYTDMLADPDRTVDLDDVCYSAGARRSHHECRLALVGSNREAMAADLRAYSAGDSAESIITGDAGTNEPPQVVFVFPGHGPTWNKACRDLLTASPRFAERLRECDEAIGPELGWLASERLTEGSPLGGVADIHPMQWAIQVSLAAVWQDWGIHPDRVIGHSMGEIAAATVAGALDIHDAATVVCRRSRLLASLSARRAKGAMWAVRLDEGTARDMISDQPGATVCVVNSPHSVVVGGEFDAVEKAIHRLRKNGIGCKQLLADGASHVPLVEPIVPQLATALEHLHPRRARIPMHSCARNAMVKGTELNRDYWIDHLRSPVRFEAAVRRTLKRAPRTLFVEISPHPVLLWPLHDIIDDCQATATVICSLRRDRQDMESLLAGLGSAYAAGCEPDWSKVSPDGRFVRLPTYSWARSTFWVSDAGPAVTEVAPVAADAAARESSRQPVGSPPVQGAGAAVAARPTMASVAKDAHAVQFAHLSGTQFREYVLRTISGVLGVRPGEIDAAGTMAGIGMDSLHALQVREKIHAELGLRISADQLMDSHTVAELCDNWRDRLHKRLARAGAMAGHVCPARGSAVRPAWSAGTSSGATTTPTTNGFTASSTEQT